MTNMIPATEYMLPNGRRRETHISFDPDTYLKAKELYDAGYKLEFEFLRTGDISCTVADHQLETDVGLKVMFRDDIRKMTPGDMINKCMEQCVEATYTKWRVHNTLAGSPWP